MKKTFTLIMGTFLLAGCSTGYTITWKNYDGTVLKVDENVKGVPQYTGETPVKPDDEYKTYTFHGWLPGVKEVKEDTSYTAYFTEKNKKYSISFVVPYSTSKNKTIQVEAGSIPSYTPPSYKDDYAEYTFKGWSPQLQPALKNMTYTAVFETTYHHVDVHFDLNGCTNYNSIDSLYKRYQLYKSNLKFDLLKTGYNFRGWEFKGNKIFDEKMEGENEQVKLYPSETKDVAIKALFEDNVRISALNYDKNGKTANFYGDLTGTGYYDYNSNNINLKFEPFEGYKFDGWYLKNDTKYVLYSDQASINFGCDTRDIDFYLKVSALRYNMTIKANNSAVGEIKFNEDSIFSPSSTKSIAFNQLVTVCANTIDNRYKFKGWYNGEILCSTEMKFSANMLNHDFTLTAVWELI